MKIILKRALVTVLTVVTLICLAMPCMAAQKGKITVNLEDRDKNKINDITVNICQIAKLDNTGYYPVPAFENSGISISGIINNPDETVAKTIADYIKKNNIDKISLPSQNGKTIFENLEIGIWLVFPEDNGKFAFNPYIVFLPFESGGMLYYEIASAPKLEDNTLNQTSIYVVKKWDDKNNASKKRPESITVELFDGKTAISSVTLCEENGWSHIFSNLPKDGNYSVKEKAVANYKANYSGDAVNGFVITNTYNGEKLPQAGQYWWPIVLIAIAGICFVLLGIYEIGVKKNVKKK